MYLIKGHINSLLRTFHFFFTASILLNMLQLCLFIKKINLKYRNTKVCKLAKWWRHTLNQVLIIYDEQRYLGQFSSEMFDSLQYESTMCASQYGLNSSVIMATYWVPDVNDFRGKFTSISKSSGWWLEKSELQR